MQFQRPEEANPAGLGRLLADRPDLFEAGEIYRLERGFYLRWVKPGLDAVLGVVALIIFSPLLLIIALTILTRMGHPVLLRQRRVGRFGNEFWLYKFRTMDPDRRANSIPYLGEDRRKTHKSSTDPRLTDLGRRLRATRLDELPQFINVAKGDMSLVGPRPELSKIVVDYDPWQHRRHAVKPGVTGLWQIAGDARLLKDCTAMELDYLVDISLVNDVQIILKTVPAMVRRSGI